MAPLSNFNSNFNVFNVFPIPIEEGWFELPLASFQSHCCRSSSIKSGVSNFSWSKSPFFNHCMSLQKKTKHLYKTSPRFEPTTFLIHDLITWRIRPLDHRGRLALAVYFICYRRTWNSRLDWYSLEVQRSEGKVDFALLKLDGVSTPAYSSDLHILGNIM